MREPVETKLGTCGAAERAARRRSRAAARVLAALALLAVAPTTGAQPGAAPDLTDLALRWARGEYRSPLVCTLGDQPRRGLRRILIAPGPRRGGPRVDRIRFFDLAAEGVRRCRNALGQEEPSLEGSLLVTLRAPSRPDVAARDFKEALRRDRGFEFEIVSGALRIAPVGDTAPPTRTVDFRGGTARLVAIRRGTDAARLLADFPSRRKLELTVRAPSGEELRLWLFQTGLR